MPAHLSKGRHGESAVPENYGKQKIVWEYI